MKFRILWTLAALLFIAIVYTMLQGNGAISTPTFGDSDTSTQQ